MAKGEYIARVDVDDPSEPERFEKQVAYMDEHPEVSVCGVWQRSITPQKSSVQKVATIINSQSVNVCFCTDSNDSLIKVFPLKSGINADIFGIIKTPNFIYH